MKISVFGLLPFSELIKQGLKQLGHTITNEDPDLIFSNDPTGYQDAIFLKLKHQNVHLILNILDIPWHFPNIEKQTQMLIERFLNKADSITAISFKVKKDLLKFLDKKVYDKIDVIYCPIQDIKYNPNIKKINKFMYVGRCNDFNKRFYLVKESLSKIENGEKDLTVCGTQNPGYGNYKGYVPVNKLSDLYNSTKFIFLPSKNEGVGLSMIEAMICGSLPILCSDNETAKEFLPNDFICDPDAQSIIKHINKLEKNFIHMQQIALKLGNKYKEQFDKIKIAKNILNVKK